MTGGKLSNTSLENHKKDTNISTKLRKEEKLTSLEDINKFVGT